MVDEGSFRLSRLLRKLGEEPEPEFEFGAHAFGPDAAALAETMAEQMRVWGRAHRGGPGPSIAAYPAGTPDDQLPEGRVINKRHVRIPHLLAVAAH